MRFRRLDKWDDKENSQGLIFVAQLIDELLFEYTLDSYKPSAMNTALLIREAVNTISAINAGIVMKPNLKHVLDELCENIVSDPVAHRLLSVDLAGVTSTLRNQKATEASIETVVKLLRIQVPLSAYKEMNETLLREEVLGAAKRSRLRVLVRSYITTLLNFGYTSRYIARESQNFFHYSLDRISGNEAIAEYFELFSKGVHEYHVIYKAPSYLLAFKDAAERIGLKVLKGPEESTFTVEELGRYGFHSNDVFVYVSSRGKEPNFAREVADKKVEAIQTLIGLYHHKEAPRKIMECVIKDADTGVCEKSSRHINPMHRCADAIPAVASKKLSRFMGAFSLEEDSFSKFHRSAELHALALASESLENQMINLWIALESLIPSKSDTDLAQIDHIANSVIPCLNLEYIGKLLTRFFKDLRNWNKGLVKRIYKDIEGQGIASKTARLLALPDHQNLRVELENNFGDYHLLRDRYEYLVGLVSSPASIINVLEGHKTRVGWQLRRIYRARNTIVHDGTTPSYTEVLVENIHDYLDVIMRWLMELASKDKTIYSVAQGFKMIELNYLSYRKSLEEKQLVFTKDNIDHLLMRFSYA
ncbi:HEPN domain-containing protein [Pseudomonas mosselii]|uniref:HEPN domain-containing protein n=1 Tax=Pseudomonas mosselii TaxID=78327 RepID=UPI000A51F7AD|nr:HEPN domain-containing protein [Pseudomonas mosselii]